MDETGHRIVVLGPAKAGKTALLKRFFEGQFIEKYRETVEDLYSQTFCVNGLTRMAVEALDTAGNMEFPVQRRISIASCQAVLLVCDITDPQWLKSARSLFQEIRQLRSLDHNLIPIVLAANKVDLCNDYAVDETEFLAWKETIGAQHCGNLACLPTSAKTAQNVYEVFVTFLRLSGLPYELPTCRGAADTKSPIMRKLSLQIEHLMVQPFPMSPGYRKRSEQLVDGVPASQGKKSVPPSANRKQGRSPRSCRRSNSRNSSHAGEEETQHMQQCYIQ